MSGHVDRVERFLALHAGEKPLLLPNPWDRGSAKLFASLDFEALATTSSGSAAKLGRLDGSVTREEAIAAEAAHSGLSRLVLTARAENHLHGVTELANTIKRLQAYEEVGANDGDVGNAQRSIVSHESSPLARASR